MVITVKLLSKKNGAAEIANYFLGLAHDRYYTEGGERPGEWYGGAAQALGLFGKVKDEVFMNLLFGADAMGKPLMKRTKKNTVMGIDLCCNLDKGFSAYYAASSDDMRRQLDGCYDRAIKRTIDLAERTIPLLRRGRMGTEEQYGKLLVAMFDHSTSRVSATSGRVEPNIHRHAVVLNVAQAADGRFQTINTLKLHYWARTLGPIMHANLAQELHQELGMACHRPLRANGTPATWMELSGIPQPLIKHWSSRSGEMEDKLAGSFEAGITTHPTSAGAKQWANLETRREKTEVPPLEKLLPLWREEAAAFGLTPERLDALLGQSVPVADPAQQFEEAWRAALTCLTEKNSYFTFRHLLRETAERLQATGLGGDWIVEQVQSRLELDPQLIPLAMEKREACFTTPEMWQLEKRLLANVEILRRSSAAAVSPQVLESTLAAHPTLSQDQATAVRDVLQESGGIRLLSGVAGAGKSFTAAVIREAFEASGYRVLGAALSGVATEELHAASGIVARTYASYAYQWTQTFPGSRPEEHKNGLDQPTTVSTRQKPRSAFDLDPRTVLVVDEAGMLGSRDVELLTEHALRNQATLILIGDAKQLQPIMAGGPFGHLLGKIDQARLTENRRQQNPLDAEAVADIRRGDAEKALLNYAARDRLTVGENRNDTLRKLVSEWASNGGSAAPADHQIFTMTRAEAQAVNRLCQRERLLLGGLRGQVSLQRDDDLFVTGDRILFHKNSKADGIRNGYRGVITGIDKLTERITIRLDTPSDSPRIVTIALRNYTSEDLTLGYAQTTHKGQGQTVGHAYLLLGGLMTDRESAYVQATRGKESTRLYVDRAELGHEWETLIDSLNRSNPKKLAHDLGKRSEQQFTEIIPTHSLERRISP